MSLGLVPGKTLVICPKVEEPTLVFGGGNWVRLNMLKNSLRNSSPNLLSGPNWVRLNRAKSKLFTPGPGRLGSVRDSSAKVKSAGETKQAVLKNSLSDETPAGLDVLQPGTLFGRDPAPNPVVKFEFPLVKTRGKPFWNVVTPSMPQPLTTLSIAPSNPDKYLLPRPKGRSRT